MFWRHHKNMKSIYIFLLPLMTWMRMDVQDWIVLLSNVVFTDQIINWRRLQKKKNRNCVPMSKDVNKLAVHFQEVTDHLSYELWLRWMGELESFPFSIQPLHPDDMSIHVPIQFYIILCESQSQNNLSTSGHHCIKTLILHCTT